ncbi:MAG: hypothetical protein QXP13_04740 [Candidatus Methanomethylicia archaeon]
MIREAIRRAGFSWRPYVLRAYFDTQLMIAELKGLILRDYCQFWMGHKGDIEARYTTNKCRLPEDVIEDMHKAYRRSQEYLQTTVCEVSRESIAEKLRRQLLLVAGFTPEEINKLNLEGLSDEEFQEIIKKKLLGGDRGEDCIHRVVKLENVERYLRMGWLYMSSLPDGRVIVKKPG